MDVRDDALAAEIERILDSDTFRNSEALRRLLRFLADKRMSGEADQLKEYSVGIDVLGKPPTYDPRHDSTVRIQIGRLRTKLGEYYRTEGKHDTLVVDLPKGRFKLTVEKNETTIGANHLVAAEGLEKADPAISGTESARIRAKRVVLGLSLALPVALVWAATATIQFWRVREKSSLYSSWTPELAQLWNPLLASRRPLVISIADPPFVQFKGFGAYRDLTLNRWEDIIKSPAVIAIRKALHDADVQPNLYYAPMGEVNAAFLIGKLLGPRVETLSLLRTSELSVQQMANNDVVFIGAPVFFEGKLPGLPVQLDLVNARPGIHNLHPLTGEPALLSDQLPTSASEDGEAYILVTRVPGPLGTTEVLTFTSNRTPGRLTAVEWFTDPSRARTLVEKLRSRTGQVPRFFQVVFKVKYKNGVPIETSYVFHHEVRPSGNF